MTDLYIRVGDAYQKVGSLLLAAAQAPKDSPGQYSPAFEAFWANYPRRRAKGAAWKAWCKIKGGQAVYAAISSALEAQKRTPEWLKDAGQFIPHPATWLNQRRWEDDTAPPLLSYRPAVRRCPGWGDDRCQVAIRDGEEFCYMHLAMKEDLDERAEAEPEFLEPE